MCWSLDFLRSIYKTPLRTRAYAICSEISQLSKIYFSDEISIFFFFFAQKIGAVLTSTKYLCFRAKIIKQCIPL